MIKNSLFVLIGSIIFLLFGANAAFAQCGADGTQPCPSTTPKKKTTPKKPPTPKKSTAKTTVSKPQTTIKKPQTSLTKPQAKFVPRAPDIAMVKIPEGSFMMGSNKYDLEKPIHRVTISYSFYMGKYEVTQAQWRMVMGNNPSNFKEDNLPVENVSWNDAQDFIRKLNNLQSDYKYRLPTEAEWEYAARAGTTTQFTFGDSLSSSQANFDGDYPYGSASKGPNLQRTTSVGGYQPNDWELYDMHGNVWEWVEDIFQISYNRLSVDGSANTSQGDSSLRVLRGGSWGSGGISCRSAHRGADAPAKRDKNTGFRLVARPNYDSL